MQKALTAKSIEALKPRDKRHEIYDLLCSGLSVCVTKQGRRIFPRNIVLNPVRRARWYGRSVASGLRSDYRSEMV